MGDRDAGHHDRAGFPPWAMAIAAMLCVQSTNALSVPVIAQAGPAGTAWLRLCFGAVVVAAIGRPKLGALRRAQLPALVALGVATGFMTLSLLAAVDRIPLGTAVAIEFLGPLSVAALKSRQAGALIWPLLAFVGVLLLTEPWRGSLDLAGVGFAVAAGTCWALYNLLTQHVGDQFAGMSGLSMTLPIAALATLPLGLPQVISRHVHWWVLPAAAALALVSPVIAFGLEMLALHRMTHTAFGTLLSIEPGIGVLLGLLLLGQHPHATQLAGIALVVLAGAAAQRRGQRN